MVISVDTGNKMIKTEWSLLNVMYCLVYFPTQHLLHLQPVVLKQQIISWLHGARCLEGK